jgi:hypothetical protein
MRDRDEANRGAHDASWGKSAGDGAGGAAAGRLDGAGDRASASTAFLDLHMLVLLGGQERTEAELSRLFAGAGFTLSRILPAGQAMRILECIPA